jgi:hypothetical protein
MTADTNLVCSRCGFSNVPGDAFCGSCGAFLEWEGQPSTPAAGTSGLAPVPPVAEDRDPDVPVVGGPTGASEAPTQAYVYSQTAGVMPPVPVTVPAPGPADAGLLRCPACGVANQAGRTFCMSCGARLEAAAAKVAAPTKEQIAAAVAAPNRPPAAPSASAAAGSRPGQEGSGGIVKWLVVLALLGVLGGVLLVVGLNVIRGQGPASDASANPTAPAASGGTVNATPGASGEVPSAEPGATGGTAPTASPEAKPLALLSATASSVVGGLEKFEPGKAIDGDPATSWQEGAKKEKGEWIEVTFGPATVSRVVIRNGYGASDALYRGNKRLKDVLISVDGGEGQAFRLKDTSKAQSIAITGGPGATTLRITIVSTYPASKTSVANTPFDDTAVSEIRVFGVAGT